MLHLRKVDEQIVLCMLENVSDIDDLAILLHNYSKLVMRIGHCESDL